MAQGKPTDQKDLRIRIKRKDLADFVESDIPTDLIHHWIKLGRDEYQRQKNDQGNGSEDLEKKVEQLSADLKSFIFLAMQIFELISLPGSMEQCRVFKLIQSKGKENLSGQVALEAAEISREKSVIFNKLARQLFPDMELGLLMNFHHKKEEP